MQKRSECLSGIPLHVRGNVIDGVLDVSKAQFAKLLKMVAFKFWFQPSLVWNSTIIFMNGL
jgi:hypothetical protein